MSFDGFDGFDTKSMRSAGLDSRTLTDANGTTVEELLDSRGGAGGGAMIKMPEVVAGDMLKTPCVICGGAMKAWCDGPTNHRHPGSCIEALRARLVPAPWTPERRERVGRAAHHAGFAAKNGYAFGVLEDMWRRTSEEKKEDWRAVGEAAARADEEGR